MFSFTIFISMLVVLVRDHRELDHLARFSQIQRYGVLHNAASNVFVRPMVTQWKSWSWLVTLNEKRTWLRPISSALPFLDSSPPLIPKSMSKLILSCQLSCECLWIHSLGLTHCVWSEALHGPFVPFPPRNNVLVLKVLCAQQEDWGRRYFFS